MRKEENYAPCFSLEIHTVIRFFFLSNLPDPLERLRVVCVLGEPLGQVHHVLGQRQVRHVRRARPVVLWVGPGGGGRRSRVLPASGGGYAGGHGVGRGLDHPAHRDQGLERVSYGLPVKR